MVSRAFVCLSYVSKVSFARHGCDIRVLYLCWRFREATELLFQLRPLRFQSLHTLGELFYLGLWLIRAMGEQIAPCVLSMSRLTP